MILAMGRNMKWMMKLNIYLMPLEKILEINYTYCYLKTAEKKILWRVTILFIDQRMGEIGESFRANKR